MALHRSSRPLNQLDTALAEFNGKLTQDERSRFRAVQSVPDANAAVTLTAQLDQAAVKRSGRCIASRLSHLLTSVQQFSGIVGTFVSSNPAVAALVWGSVEFVLRLANNSFTFFDKLSLFLMDIGKLCPHFAEYQALFFDVPTLQSALSNFYAEIIRCCTRICEVLRRSDWLNFARSAWVPFEAEFGPFRARVLSLAADVKGQIELSAVKAEQAHRVDMGRFVKRDEERRLRRLQDDESRRRRALIDAVSMYDQRTAYHQARSRCHSGTAAWLMDEEDFKKWKSSNESSTFALYGKLGCGKTILLSSVIAHLFAEQYAGLSTQIAYFFCRFNEERSLQATTVLRSIIRQCLSEHLITKELDVALTALPTDEPWSMQYLARLLGMAIRSSTTCFVIIDGIEECTEREQRLLLSTLSSVIEASAAPVKLLLSGRNCFESLGSVPGQRYDYSVRDSTVAAEIATYVHHELHERQSAGGLEIGDPHLFLEIRHALIAGAQGMFLWVVLQMDEVCAQACDRDIRSALVNLPVGLDETYRRMLSRITNNGRDELARQIFRWVAIARRPLSLPELQEAIAVEKFSPYSKPDRFINKITRIFMWCEGLIFLDEISGEVSFAHPTVKPVLTNPDAQRNTLHFTFSLRDADKEAGEICATYLNFNDFKTELIKRNALQDVTAERLLDASLSSTSLNSKIVESIRKISMLQARSRRKDLNIGQQLIQVHVTQHRKVGHNDHPFLRYASEFWLAHSTRFRQEDAIWHLWCALLPDENRLPDKPWPSDAWSKRHAMIASYIYNHDHVALLRAIQSSATMFSEDELDQILVGSAGSEAIGVFEEIWWRAGKNKERASEALHFAASHGSLAIARRLLTIEMDSNTQPNKFGSSLQAASGKGFQEIVELLLDRGVVNRVSVMEYKAATEAAVEGGHEEIVQLLLYRYRAEAKPWKFVDLDKALCTASSIGHLAMMRVLLDYGAAMEQGHYSVLTLASSGGHLDAVKYLLERGAKVNFWSEECDSALVAASAKGWTEVVRLLLDRGANIDLERGPSGHALWVALEKGLCDVAELLLECGANVRFWGKICQLTFLTASARGDCRVVQLLLDKGTDLTLFVDHDDEPGGGAIPASMRGHYSEAELLLDRGVNIRYGDDIGTNAMRAAFRGGHYEVVALLLEYGVSIKHLGHSEFRSALAHGHMELVHLLMEHGIRDLDREMADKTLITASVGGHHEAVQLLLNRGASPQQYAALEAASARGHQNVVRLLLDYGADIKEVRCARGFITASARGHLEVVRLLLDSGVDTDEIGRLHLSRALQAARAGGQSEVVKLLMGRDSSTSVGPKVQDDAKDKERL